MTFYDKFLWQFLNIYSSCSFFCFIFYLLEIIKMVKNMKKAKISSTNLIIIFFISYGFYTLQLLSQRLYNLYSKEAIFPICIMYTLMPIVTFFVCKIINKNKIQSKIKTSFIYSTISSLYLIVTLTLALIYISNLIYIYYYPESLLIVLLIFLVLPMIYTLIKGDHVFYYLASILLIITFIFKYVYTKNSPQVELFTLYNFFKISKENILSIFILIIPLLLEPLLLINNIKDLENKINIKLALTLSIILSIVSLTTNLRLLFEFGTLIGKIRFPYLESIKNIVAGKFFENIDYYYLLSIVFSIYARTGYSIITIKRNFNLDKIKSIILLLLVILLAYLGQKSMKVYDKILIPLLITCSICLLILLITLPFLIKRRKKENV